MAFYLRKTFTIFSLYYSENKNIPQVLTEIAKIIPLSETDIAQFKKWHSIAADEITLKLRLTENESDLRKSIPFPGALIKAQLIQQPLGAIQPCLGLCRA